MISDHVERTLTAWETLGEPVTIEQVIRLVLDLAEANIGRDGDELKVSPDDVAYVAQRLEKIGEFA